MQIIVKNFEHYNRALGTHVKNKDHYDRLMKEGGYVTYEENQERVKDNGNKPYSLSKKGWEIIHAAKNSKDSKGKVKLSDRTIDAMKEIGVGMQKVPSYMQLPSAYTGKGGFNT
jgi:hypothetical protein